MSMNSIEAPAFADDLYEGEWDGDLYWTSVAIPSGVFLQENIASESFCFDNEVPSSDGRPVPSVGQPLAPGVEDQQSPLLSSSASDPAVGQHPCLEAGISATRPCNAHIADSYYRVTSDAQKFLWAPFTNISGAGFVDAPNSDPVITQDADAYTPGFINPASGSPSVTAAYVSQSALLTESTTPNPAVVDLQQKPHRCGLLLGSRSNLSEQRICDGAFSQRKDLRRHIMSCHPMYDDRVYLCRCGKDCSRKDNHSRHVNKCTEARIPSYECKCSYRYEDKGDYLNHLRNCRFGHRPRGRPSAS